MSKAGQKILDGLKDAIKGNFAAVTIEGQRWVRADVPAADTDKLAGLVDRFTISWERGAYYVSIPNYQGGEVVPASEYDALSAQVARLQEALKPFAILGAMLEGPFAPALFKDEDSAGIGGAWSENGEPRFVTFGDLRRARAALSPTEAGDNQSSATAATATIADRPGNTVDPEPVAGDTGERELTAAEMRGRYLIWWTGQEDCARIVPLDTWPVYLYDEYQSRLGRNGRGRLWVSSKLKDPPQSTSLWDVTNNWLCAAALGAAGIVIKAEHARHVQFLPGFLTTFEMGLPTATEKA